MLTGVLGRRSCIVLDGRSHKLAVLASTGKPRIIEAVVPLTLTEHADTAAEAVLATFGLRVGCVTRQHPFDLYVTLALPPEAILHVHSEGDSQFDTMAVGYPAEYVDRDEDYWRLLTGEHD